MNIRPFIKLRDISALAGATQYKIPQFPIFYTYPGTYGQGQTIGIICLGGGYYDSDMNTYFSTYARQRPSITQVLVGAGNNPDNSISDWEIALDIQAAASVAPLAKIVVYYSPPTIPGFIGCFQKAINDNINRPSVISCSWGSPEVYWLDPQRKQLGRLFATAASRGITITCASGDLGSQDGSGQTGVIYPASDPYVLAVGGTTLNVGGNNITSETGWSGSGGGYSKFFATPSYQPGRPMRGIPDIAADADPNTGYLVYAHNRWGVAGGTSASAPLTAGLVACFNGYLKALGRPSVGFLHPKLYGPLKSKGAIRDIVVGSNGAYNCGPGWNPVTGLGVINGEVALYHLVNG